MPSNKSSRVSPNRRKKSPWAVTDEFPHKYGQQLANPAKEGDPTTIAKQAAMELEKRLGIKPLPKLHCFTMNLAGDRPDPEEIQRQQEVKQREKERGQHVRRLRHMYQLALANKATSQRILDKNAEFSNHLGSTTVEDLTSNLDAMLAFNSEDDSEDENMSWMKYVNQRALVPVTETVDGPPNLPLPAPGAGTTTIATIPSKATPGKNKKPALKALPSPPPPPPPLSVEALVAPKILEAKCLSTLWINYSKEQSGTALME